jgi:hypothetical protein
MKMIIHDCGFCGRWIRDFRDHLPRCPALGKEARR